MKTHKQLVEDMLKDPAVRAEYERIEREEMPMLDAILNARTEAGLTQAQVAEPLKTNTLGVTIST